MQVPEGCPLTRREFETTLLLAEGLSREDIGKRMKVAESTVRTYVFDACEKLDVHSAAGLVTYAYVAGWMPGNSRAELAEERLAKLALQLADEQEAERDRVRLAVTPGQALYLQSFERWLRSPDDEARSMERALCLRAMYHESSWASQSKGGPPVIPPWEVLGAPQRKRRPTRVFKLP